MADASLAMDEEQELQALLAVLDEQTELATRTRMNADFVPGMVTVLHGEELDERGIQTVAQALDTVPGLRVTFVNDGSLITLVRGVGTTLNSGNLKLLLNGISMNSTATGLADAVLRIPIEQIDRIEVVRGPGSAVHGEFAFSGVVNVITREADRGAYLELGSHGGRSLGAMYGDVRADLGLRWFANFSAWDSDGSGRNSGEDLFAARGAGHSPGDIDDYEKGRLLLLGAEFAGFILRGQWLRVERGGYFGNNALAPEGGLSPRRENVLNFSLRRRWEFSDRLAAELLLNSLNNDLEEAEYLPIPGGIVPPAGPPALPRDIFRQESVDDVRREAQARLYWQPHTDHRLLFGLDLVRAEVDAAWSRFADENGPLPPLAGDTRRVVPGASRRVASLTLQDQWRIREEIELTAGLRYDDYSDAGNNLSPRIAAVWRPAERHVFKAQYAEAFRPPTLIEDNPGSGASGLSPETLSSVELAYIYKGINRVHRFIVFDTELRDVIEFELIPGRAPRLVNRGRLRTRGFEAEYQHRLGEWEILANVSYADTQDEKSNASLPGSSRWLAHLELVWRPGAGISNAVRLAFVGDQKRYPSVNDAPDSLSEFARVDYTLTLRNLFQQRGLSLAAGVMNLFDNRAATLARPAFYPADLPLDERTWWAKASLRF
ncbi:MAG: TonB-dependent receptor [Chromatiales bacterium]|nr:TonB-dependent receptor [Chromatiales bacterium]